LDELALAEDGVLEIETRKLVLPRAAGCLQLVENPVVKGAVIFELQGAERVCHALQRV
jgi:hypothetical protein